MKRNIKLTIEFDGTAYHGWQSQENAVTVQDTVTAAVCTLTGENCSLTGSSRTDTGVHALGFVCNFFTESSIPADKFAFALNTLLPEDIAVIRSEEVPPDFHSRFSAKGKKYSYLIYNAVFPSALLRHRAYHVYYPLDVGAMNEAAQFFIGTHDFLAFSASGYSAKTTVRTIMEAAVITVSQAQHSILPGSGGGQLIEFSVIGDGFLYNMVRIMAGTLVEVGFGKLKPQDMSEIISGLDRRKAGRTAPAHGLYLAEVFY
jgi:tRNA pseudouridine38-40 synthase